MKTKTLADVRLFAEKVAAHHEWKLNPDDDFRESVLQGLLVNHNRYGFYQCPCRDSHGDQVRDKDIQCPCDYCPPDLEEFDRCFCCLFMTDDYVRGGAEAAPIPDRRPDSRYPPV